MKKKNIMLGFATLLFAAGAAFASVKVNSANTTMAYYLEDEDDPLSTCHQYIVVNCDPGEETCREEIPGVGDRQLWEAGCTSPLERNTGF